MMFAGTLFGGPRVAVSPACRRAERVVRARRLCAWGSAFGGSNSANGNAAAAGTLAMTGGTLVSPEMLISGGLLTGNGTIFAAGGDAGKLAGAARRARAPDVCGHVKSSKTMNQNLKNAYAIAFGPRHWGGARKLRGDSVLRLPATSPRASLSGKGWRTHYRGAELTMLIPQRRRDAARNGWRVPPEKFSRQFKDGSSAVAANEFLV
jgi:hypothetical protein